MTTEELKDFDDLLKKGIEEAKEYRTTKGIELSIPPYSVYNTENSYKEAISKLNFEGLLDEIISAFQWKGNIKATVVSKHLAKYLAFIGVSYESLFWENLYEAHKRPCCAKTAGDYMFYAKEFSFTKIQKNLAYAKNLYKLALDVSDPYHAEKFLKEHRDFFYRAELSKYEANNLLKDPDVIDMLIESAYSYTSMHKYETAFKVFVNFADKNIYDAQLATALCYLHGFGVDKNLVQATIHIQYATLNCLKKQLVAKYGEKVSVNDDWYEFVYHDEKIFHTIKDDIIRISSLMGLDSNIELEEIQSLCDNLASNPTSVSDLDVRLYSITL